MLYKCACSQKSSVQFGKKLNDGLRTKKNERKREENAKYLLLQFAETQDIMNININEM